MYCFRRNWTNASNELVYMDMEVDRVVPASQRPFSRVYGSYTLLDVRIQALKDLAGYG